MLKSLNNHKFIVGEKTDPLASDLWPSLAATLKEHILLEMWE